MSTVNGIEVHSEIYQFLLVAEGWDRWPEVRAYILDRGISFDEGIEELVNAGLSHQPAEPVTSVDMRP